MTITYVYPFSNASNELILAVWRKERIVPGYSPDEWRYDMCGHPIRFADHGNTNSKHGWEIDHILPIASGGPDDLSNLQPLYWVSNRQKGDTYPWYCENAAA